MVQGGNLLKFSVRSLWYIWNGTGDSAEMMGIIKINFGHYVGIYWLWYFCAGNGPMQLGIVLVFFILKELKCKGDFQKVWFLRVIPLWYNVKNFYFCSNMSYLKPGPWNLDKALDFIRPYPACLISVYGLMPRQYQYGDTSTAFISPITKKVIRKLFCGVNAGSHGE